MRLLAAYGAVNLALAAGVAFVLLNPNAGRPFANGHPDVRGGGDRGFGGSDFYS